ncbi:hypothetical protein GCM10007108_16380 [Thermogymnomonas acidicola]|uniref:Cystathionine gamma-synthase n=1 Tax=Thermogymnomonas acidicola TaxID=399579 RepID=A0AA37BT08_9ARCH|nr:PLP-dependent transferase [Thermogymnomonas acidicola]GGM78917.1 hypothetical protein GCM10007108_16380 [Thermogymnomonas acidicola]
MRSPASFHRDTEDPVAHSLVFPIYQTSSFLMPEGEHYRYGREWNPTVEELARKMDMLEGTPSSTCFSSGMGAITSLLLSHLRPGSRLLIHRDMFSRTYRFAREFLASFGVSVSVAEPGSEEFIRMVRSEKPDMALLESVTNPVLRVMDIPRIAEACREVGARFIVDSTLATPVNQKPFGMGADAVIHSASKFLSGHNDVIAGTLSGREEIVRRADDMRRNLGSTLDPQSAFLVMRGLRTLEVRMERINRDAERVAEELCSLEHVRDVIYPGLKEHPDHDISRRVLCHPGGVITFHLSEDIDPQAFMRALGVVAPANTLGGVFSTISQPYTMSHRGLSEEEKEKLGITRGMMRLSVGLEGADAIVEDIRGAISRARLYSPHLGQ